MTYVDTLFGHQAEIVGMDCLQDDRILTAGRDKTVRLWKIKEEAQLLFQGGHTMSVDAVAKLSAKRYFTGSQDGAVALWTTEKKKPVHISQGAHSGQWITAVAALKYTVCVRILPTFLVPQCLCAVIRTWLHLARVMGLSTCGTVELKV